MRNTQYGQVHMKQIAQLYSSGELRLEEVPVPICKSGGVLVRTACSLVSAGTERMKVTQARMGMLQKARSRPDKVRQVIQTVKQRGLLETYRLVQERLNAERSWAPVSSTESCRSSDAARATMRPTLVNAARPAGEST